MKRGELQVTGEHGGSEENMTHVKSHGRKSRIKSCLWDSNEPGKLINCCTRITTNAIKEKLETLTCLSAYAGPRCQGLLYAF